MSDVTDDTPDETTAPYNPYEGAEPIVHVALESDADGIFAAGGICAPITALYESVQFGQYQERPYADAMRDWMGQAARAHAAEMERRALLPDAEREAEDAARLVAYRQHQAERQAVEAVQHHRDNRLLRRARRRLAKWITPNRLPDPTCPCGVNHWRDEWDDNEW